MYGKQIWIRKEIFMDHVQVASWSSPTDVEKNKTEKLGQGSRYANEEFNWTAVAHNNRSIFCVSLKSRPPSTATIVKPVLANEKNC